MSIIKRMTVKRLAAFSIVMLVIYLLIIGFVQDRQTEEAIDAAQDSIATLTDTNAQLVETNDDLIDRARRLVEQRDLLFRLNEAQAQRIRDLGGEPVDAFDPEVSGEDPEGQRSPLSPSTVPVLPAPAPSGGSGGPQAAPEPPQQPSDPGPSPEPSEPPSEPSSPPPVLPDEICTLDGIPCLENPLPPIILPPVLDLHLSQQASADLALVSTLEDPMDFFNVDAATASRVIGLLVPLLVAFITKRYASSGLKAALNMTASAILGSLSYLVAFDGGYDVRGFVNAALNTMMISVASYYGFFKPTGITDSMQAKTENLGFGRKPVLETDSKVESRDEVIRESSGPS